MTATQPLRIRQTLIKEISRYPNNPRHNEHAVAKVRAAIEEFGWKQPIVVDAKGEIVVGDTRYQAAVQMGLEKVPVVWAKDLSPAQVKAYRIADNRVGEDATWNKGLLAMELEILQSLEFNLGITGLADDELAKYIDIELPPLPDAERDPFQQMIFILHDDQVAMVKAAVAVALKLGAGKSDLNENGNGNALAVIAAEYLKAHAD